MDRSSTRRGTITAHHWGSDADLASDVGMRLDPELREHQCVTRPAPVMLSATRRERTSPSAVVDLNWKFPSASSGSTPTGEDEEAESDRAHSPGETSMMTPRRMSFFDVGGLLENSYGGRPPQVMLTSSDDPTPSPPISRDSTTSQPVRKGSRAFMEDMGGLLTPHDEIPRTPPSPTRNFSRPTTAQVSPPDNPTPTLKFTSTPGQTLPSPNTNINNRRNTRPTRIALPRHNTLRDVGGS